MKKNLLSLLLCLIAFCLSGTLNAQQPIYQLPNGGFEEWYQETSDPKSIAPVGFNSFYSANPAGSLTSLGIDQRCDKSFDVREGATGIHSLRLFSTNVTVLFITVRANGNITTGRIHMGSTTANSADNYNHTDLVTNAPKHYQEITGTPDSMRFWVKYLPGSNQNPNITDKGRIRVYIHGTNPCRDAPSYPSGMTETQLYYGKAMREFFKEDGGWNCYQVPFEYTGTNDVRNANGNYYALVSMTTNAQPGGGANNPDQVWFDDVEFIYSAWLTDLKVNGVTIDGFQKNLLTYGGPKLTGTPGSYAFPYQPADFSYTKEAKGEVNVAITNVPGPAGDADGGYTSILVTAEDQVTQKEYRVYYFANLSDNNNIAALSYTLCEETTPVPGFISSQLNYTVTLTNPEDTCIPKIRVEDIVLSDAAASIQSITPLTSVPSGGIAAVISVVARAENFSAKTYTVSFSKVPSSNSTLNWIKIGGTDIANFDSDTLEYNYEIATCVTAAANIPAVTYEKFSVYADVSYTPATLTNRTATILVTAENGTQTTYKINFILSNNNANLTGYRVNTTNRNVFNASTFVDTYSASFTAAPSLTVQAAQQSCQGSTVAIPPPFVWFPDTNKITVTAQDGITTQIYGSIIKNTNCYLKQTSGSNIGLKYRYNGVVRSITVPSSSNNNDVTINVTIPVVGPNEPCELIEADPQAPVVDTIIYTQPIARAGNSGRVRVVANDGVAGKNYIINFTATISTDATLNNITSNGFQLPGFNPATEFYTLIIPSSVTDVPNIEFTPNFQWLPETNIVFTPATSFSDTVTIAVTAENNTTKKTYRIVFKVVEQAEDAYLTDIRYANVTIPGFNPITFDYTVNIPYSAPTPPDITAYASSPTALVLYATQLNTPPYTQKILVHSENMEVYEIYTINFNLVKNTNAALTEIQINGISLQDFNSKVFDYDYELNYTELNAPVVTATPAFEHAQVNITQINTTTGIVTINVTAEDEAYTADYTINFTRELSPVTAIEAIVYNYNDQTYTHEVTVTGTEITIILPVETLGEPVIDNIVLADHRAVFTIEDQPDETNDLTGTVIVTAEDLTEEPYTVIFERTLSESVLLTDISISIAGVVISDFVFNPDITTYDLFLPFDNTHTPVVTATAHWQNTEVQITQAGGPFGQAIVYVTSENEQNTKTYTITFQRKGTPYLVSLSYNLDGTSYQIPGFDPEIFEYSVTLPIATTATPELEYVLTDSRCTVERDDQTTPNGTSQLKIITWNYDDSVTYTVTFTVLLCTTPTLSDLQVNGVTISNFNPNTLNYSIQYPYGTEELPEVTAEITCLDGEVEITQITEYPGVATIMVTAGNGDTQTYTISFSVEPGNNTYLSTIFVNGNILAEFDKNQYFYPVLMPYNASQPTVDATPEDPRSDVVINVAPVGDTAKIYVTALNGDVALYQVYLIPGKNPNCRIETISIDWKPFEDFDPYIYEYEYILPVGYTGTPFVAPVLENPNATYKMEWLANLLLITVTAENEVNTCIYRIVFEGGHSILTFETETEIRVYPNPSSDNIHFQIDEQIQSGYLEIYSIENKKIGRYLLQGGVNTIQIGDLSKGIYFYKIFTDKAMLGAGKFVRN